MGFEQRIKKAQQFEQEVEQYCHIFAQAVAKNGSEHTHPDFVRLIRKNDDPGSKLVRFEPDGILLLNDNVWHWEAKYAQNLEKDAYKTYMDLKRIGCSILIFIKHPQNNIVFWNEVLKIGFIDSYQVVSKYPKDKRHPIDSDGWIHPKQGTGFAGEGSGTPYKEIDFNTLKKIPDFYKIIS